MKNLNLGVKIGLGFGVLLLIAALLGGLAMFSMGKVGAQAERLGTEVVPQVEVAGDIERSYMGAMTNLRSYGLSGSAVFWEQTRKSFADVDNALAQAQALSTRYPQLATLRANLERTNALVAEYKRLGAQTQAANKQLDTLRSSLDQAAKAFSSITAAFLAYHLETLGKEVDAQVDPARLKERRDKIGAMGAVVASGANIREAVYKAQALRDYSGMAEVTRQFEDIERILDGLKAVTRQAANLEQLAGIRRAAQEYKVAMGHIVDEFQRAQALAAKRNEVSETALAAVKDTAAAGMREARQVTALASSTLSTASAVMLGGLVCALLVGAIVGAVITRGITGPVAKGVAFAQSMAEGDLTHDLDVDQKDEIGVLAKALREMTEHLSQVMTEVHTGADNVAAGSTQLSATAQSPLRGHVPTGRKRRRGVVVHRRDGLHHPPECRERHPDRGHGPQGRAGRRPGRCGGLQDRGGHEADSRQDFCRRRDCPPDQPPGPQRRHRGGQGR